jgi:hypothetical protein
MGRRPPLRRSSSMGSSHPQALKILFLNFQFFIPFCIRLLREGLHTRYLTRCEVCEGGDFVASRNEAWKEIGWWVRARRHDQMAARDGVNQAASWTNSQPGTGRFGLSGPVQENVVGNACVVSV